MTRADWNNGKPHEVTPMEILDSTLDRHSSQFQENERHHRGLAQELRERLAAVRSGGGEKAQQRHAEQGKLFVRERIDRLLDAGSPFLELSPLAAWELYAATRPARASSPASGASPAANA
jgi:3-methylcrotonyl-CoA carboxylase beta subunit